MKTPVLLAMRSLFLCLLLCASALARPQEMELGGLKVRYWQPEGKGPFPLVLFSHGFHGNSRQSTFLMQALADHGYWVVAPNHRDAARLGRPEVPFQNPDSWTEATYQDRAEDMRKLLRAVRKQSWPVDTQRVALVGHSLGGYTVLGCAGAWPTWKMPEVKAVLALSPYCSVFVRRRRLGELDVPVMYQGGSLDLGITPSLARPGGAYDSTRAPSFFVKFSRAGHLAWTDLNGRFQQSICDYSVAFLDHYLKRQPGPLRLTRRADVAELRQKP